MLARPGPARSRIEGPHRNHIAVPQRDGDLTGQRWRNARAQEQKIGVECDIALHFPAAGRTSPWRRLRSSWVPGVIRGSEAGWPMRPAIGKQVSRCRHPPSQTSGRCRLRSGTGARGAWVTSADVHWISPKPPQSTQSRRSLSPRDIGRRASNLPSHAPAGPAKGHMSPIEKLNCAISRKLTSSV
jgi:hypothetical protein